MRRQGYAAPKMNTTGQLRPLEERMNEHQQERRNQKIAARRIVAAQLQGQINLVAQFAAGFTQQSLWGRLRWLLLGQDYSNRKGNYVLGSILGILVIGLGALFYLLIH